MEGLRRGLAILQNKLQKGLQHVSKKVISAAHYLSLNDLKSLKDLSAQVNQIFNMMEQSFSQKLNYLKSFSCYYLM